MSHIFISYSRKDLSFAQKIVTALATNGLDTWIDWKSIPKGEDWEQEIYRGIEAADAFLFLISPDSVVSVMCNKEIAHAVRNGKRILPIVLRDANPKTIHPEISKRNWIFCRAQKDNFRKAIRETEKTIHTDYKWIKYHTDLQVKALRWKQHNDAGRLLRGKELREAEDRIINAEEQREPQTTEIQRQYVTASRRAENRQIAKELKQAQTLAEEQRKRAEEQQRLRLGNLSAILASQADSILDIYHENSERGPILALQAYDFHRKYQGFMASTIDKALRKSLGYWHYSHRYNANAHVERPSETVEVDQTETPYTRTDEFLSMAYSQDGQYLALAKSSGMIEIWLADRINPIAELVSAVYAEPLIRIHASAGNVLSMSFCEGDRLGVLRDDNCLTIYQIKGRTCREATQVLLPPVALRKREDLFAFNKTVYRKVTCPIVFCPDNKTVIAANRNIAYVWDYAANASKPIPLARPEFEVTDPFNDPQIMDLVYSPSGDIMVLWSEGIVAWYSGSSLELTAQARLREWKPVHSYGYGHSYQYANAILSSEGNWIASCGMSGERPITVTLYVWKVPENHPTGPTLLEPYYAETADTGIDLAFSQDEKHLACRMYGGFRVWQLGHLNALKRENDFYRPVDRTIYNTEPNNVFRDIELFSKSGEPDPVSQSEGQKVFFSKDNRVLFCQSRHSIVTSYIDSNPDLSSLVLLNLQSLATVTVTPDGRRIAAQPVKDIKFTSDGNHLLILDAVDRLHIWRLNSFSGVPETWDMGKAGDDSTAYSYHRIADLGKNQFAVYGDPGMNERGEMPVIVFDRRKDALRTTSFRLRLKDAGRYLEGIVMTSRSVRLIREDGKLLIGRISRNRIISKRCRKFVDFPRTSWGEKNYFGEFDEKGKVYVLADRKNEHPYLSSDRTHRTHIFWRMTASPNGKLRETILTERSRVTAFTVARDGSKSACGHKNGMISITQFTAGTQAASFELISGQTSISGLAISGDGNLLASSGEEKSIKIWDLTHPKQSPVLLLNSGYPLTKLAFSSDNRFLVSADKQGIVRLWLLQLDDLAQALKRLVTRTISKTEWIEFVGEDIPYEPTA